MHLNFYHIAGALLPERFLHKNMRRCDNFTTQQSQRFTLKKGPWSFRMPEIHLLLLSGSVRSVWKDSSDFFLLYLLQRVRSMQPCLSHLVRRNFCLRALPILASFRISTRGLWIFFENEVCTRCCHISYKNHQQTIFCINLVFPTFTSFLI